MGSLNCPDPYKMPGGQVFGELFDAWTLDTIIVDRCFCQILRKIYNDWGCQSLFKYTIILTGVWSLSYPVGHPSSNKRNVEFRFAKVTLRLSRHLTRL